MLHALRNPGQVSLTPPSKIWIKTLRGGTR